MAIKYNGLIRFSSALKPTGPQPLDDRTVVEYISDLTNIETFSVDGASNAYRGMLVSVLEDDKVYLLKNKDEITNINSWIAIGSNNDVKIDDEYINQLIETYLNDNNYVTQEDVVIPVKDVKNGETSLIGENGIVDLSATYYTKEEIEDKFSNFELFEVVTNLPEENIEYNKVYIVASSNTGETNSFEEYIRIKGENDNPDSWEKLGEFKTNVDLSNYVTTDTLTSSLNTNEVKLSSDIEVSETENYTKGESVQEILIKLNNRIKAINSSIDSALSGGVTSIQEGSGITVDSTTSTSPKVSVNIGEQEDNAIELIDNKLYVKNLEDRLALLESLLSAFTGENAAKFITSENVAEYAITGIEYTSEEIDETNIDDDIQIGKDADGKIKLRLNSITNIAYGDAEIIPEN
jgi:hypothetical protein